MPGGKHPERTINLERNDMGNFTMDTGATPLLQVRDASCRAASTSTDGNETSIFRGIDLDVHAGQILDLVGPSGSGKSSLLTCIARLNPRAKAHLTLDGVDANDMSVEQWRTRVAYLPQKSLLPGSTVKEAIVLPYTFASMHGAQRPDDQQIRGALDAVGLADVELTRDPHDLSGGQAARVSMIRSILMFPKVLLADEVDAGLDDTNARLVGVYMADFAHRHGMAMIRVRHRAPDGLADAIATLAEGRLTVEPVGSSHAADASQPHDTAEPQTEQTTQTAQTERNAQ